MSIPTNSAPVPPAFSPKQPGQPPAKPVRRPPRLRYVFGVPLLLVLGVVTVTQAPREVGRWKLAAALDLRAEGKKEEAYSQLTEAMRWFPDNPMLLLQRADWRLEDGQREEAMADADQMLEIGGDSYQWLVIHSHFMQTVGESKRAVEDWKRIDRESRRTGTPDRAIALNGLAYARAIADVEIDEGLENINDALDRSPGNAALLDTRAFLLYRKGGSGSLAAALKDMNQAVTAIEGSISGIRSEERRRAIKADRFSLLQSYPKTWREAAPFGETDMATRQESVLRGAAVMYYHRALIYEALGREVGAQTDRDAARKLIGKEPDETLF